MVTGFRIQTTQGDEFSLGNIGKTTSLRTFTFEGNSLLVGFYGSKVDWQINSVGLIYLDSSCLPGDGAVIPAVVYVTTGRSNWILILEDIAVGVLLIALIAALIVICFLCCCRKNIKQVGAH